MGKPDVQGASHAQQQQQRGGGRLRSLPGQQNAQLWHVDIAQAAPKWKPFAVLQQESVNTDKPPPCCETSARHLHRWGILLVNEKHTLLPAGLRIVQLLRVSHLHG